MDDQTWRRRTAVPLMVASVAYLVAYSWRVVGDLQGTAWAIATAVIGITWAIFVLDYLVRLAMARRRWQWFRTNLGALAFALLPVLRLVRLLRVLTHLPGIRTSAGGRLRTRILVYGIGVALTLIGISSLTVVEVERGAPNANITNFGEAVWWACVTVTTTGFGDYTPVTVAGRAIGIGLMFGGVALAGIITATLASWVLERAAAGRDDEEPATRAQMRTLMAKVDTMTRDAGLAPDRGGNPDRPIGDGGDDRPGG